MARRACIDCARPFTPATGRPGSRCPRCQALDSRANPHGSPEYEPLRAELVAEAVRSGVGCVRCGTLQGLTLDFRVPWRRWKGRPLDRRNLQVLCGGCNLRKSDRVV